MTTRDRRVAVGFALAAFVFCSHPNRTTAGENAADSTAAHRGAQAPREAKSPFFASLPSDTVRGDEFRSRHAITLDHFYELWPGAAIGRRGPIGADTGFSRYGFGAGRGAVYLGRVLLNDPQDDRVPLPLVPTTAIGDLVVAGRERVFLPERANIEGAYHIIEPAPPTGKPDVSVEFSRGDRMLRQRRLRFSSIEGRIGIDFEFDEVLNNGYSFDARDLVQGPDYGKSTTRIQGGNVRGALPGGGDYLFSFRRFTSTFNGDLIDPSAEHRRDGHVAVIRSTISGFDLSIFERSHKVSVPDSATSNHTAGLSVSAPIRVAQDVDLSLSAGYDDIHSRQTMGEGETRSRLQKGYVGAAARVSLPNDVVALAQCNATHSFDLATGWGAGVTLGKRIGERHDLVIDVERRFRMPNLGELFQPRHVLRSNPSIELVGNGDLESETALEACGGWRVRVGRLTNEIRATAVRVRNPIVYGTAPSGGAGLRSPLNGASEDLVIIENRTEVRRSVLGTLVELAGSVEYTPSERNRFFAGVPDYRALATASIGRDLFRKTSAFRFSAEYEHGGSRRSGSIDPLAAYDVVNLKLVLRLVDAHLYVQWLNVTDAEYQTVWPYLMTPRTFVYGVEWTMFD